MFFSPKDSDPYGRKISMRKGRGSSGGYDIERTHKPFFPTLTKILLIVGLGFLSWLATYTGMIELIVANAGSIDMSVRIAMAFAVAMLMLMIIYLLDALFSPIPWWLRVTYIGGYIFLTLISVGFGFGFYWKFLESRSESTRSAESAVGQVQVALEGGQARLEQLQTTFDSLATLSATKAEQERAKGGTCPKSPPGDGPRRRLREADAQNFSFAADFVRQRGGSVKKDISALNTEMAKLAKADQSTIDPVTGTRNVFLRGLNKKLDLTITRFNALRTDPQLRLFRDDFAARSQRVVFDNGRGGTFDCPDPQLQIALRGVVKAIDGLPDLTKPTINAVEGSEAIVEAFRRLTASMFGAFTFNMPPSPQELRALQQKAVRSIESPAKSARAGVQSGLGKHDFIPLFIAIFVDLCLLLVSINRPVNRMQKLVSSAHQARRAQVHQILTRVHSVHHHGRSERLDALHEAMFDSLGAQYVAVPLDVYSDNIDAPFGTEEHEDAYKRKVTEARYLATLLAALEAGGLVTQAPTMTQSGVQRKLEKARSKFADSTSFRVYRFHKGAWPAIVLDDMLGASAQIDAEERAQAQRQDEERRAQGPELGAEPRRSASVTGEKFFDELSPNTENGKDSSPWRGGLDRAANHYKAQRKKPSRGEDRVEPNFGSSKVEKDQTRADSEQTIAARDRGLGREQKTYQVNSAGEVRVDDSPIEPIENLIAESVQSAVKKGPESGFVRPEANGQFAVPSGEQASVWSKIEIRGAQYVGRVRAGGQRPQEQSQGQANDQHVLPLSRSGETDSSFLKSSAAESIENLRDAGNKRQDVLAAETLVVESPSLAEDGVDTTEDVEFDIKSIADRFNANAVKGPRR